MKRNETEAPGLVLCLDFRIGVSLADAAYVTSEIGASWKKFVFQKKGIGFCVVAGSGNGIAVDVESDANYTHDEMISFEMRQNARNIEPFIVSFDPRIFKREVILYCHDNVQHFRPEDRDGRKYDKMKKVVL